MENTIEFWYGNPSIEVHKGNLTLCHEVTGKFCIIDIPTSLILTDLCNFLQLFLPEINEIKIFRASNSKIYCCAISLFSVESSLSFIAQFADKRFNSIEEHQCTIVNILSWDCQTSEIFTKFHDKCPICLEDLDRPAISILCGHLFHVKCPVCRYHQTPPDISECDTCGEENDVRMCLICGELGCPVHSQQHFHSTGHTYFQIIETSITWDYSRQVTINRLVVSTDKLFEVQNSKKIESLMFEYNCLLSSLLETQKEYYENKIQEIEKSVEDPLLKQLENIQKDNFKLINKIEEENKLLQDSDHIIQQFALENEKKQKLTEENIKLKKQTGDRKIFRITKEVTDEIKDLEIQIKEMNFYIKTQNQLKDVGIESVEIRQKK